MSFHKGITADLTVTSIFKGKVQFELLNEGQTAKSH